MDFDCHVSDTVVMKMRTELDAPSIDSLSNKFGLARGNDGKSIALSDSAAIIAKRERLCVCKTYKRN